MWCFHFNLEFKGVFGLYFQTIIFSFQTTFHAFLHTFSPTRISTNIFKQQFSVFKYMYQTGPKNQMYQLKVSRLNCDNAKSHKGKFYPKQKLASS